MNLSLEIILKRANTTHFVFDNVFWQLSVAGQIALSRSAEVFLVISYNIHFPFKIQARQLLEFPQLSLTTMWDC